MITKKNYICVNIHQDVGLDVKVLTELTEHCFLSMHPVPSCSYQAP